MTYYINISKHLIDYYIYTLPQTLSTLYIYRLNTL